MKYINKTINIAFLVILSGCVLSNKEPELLPPDVEVVSKLNIDQRSAKLQYITFKESGKIYVTGLFNDEFIYTVADRQIATRMKPLSLNLDTLKERQLVSSGGYWSTETMDGYKVILERENKTNKTRDIYLYNITNQKMKWLFSTINKYFDLDGLQLIENKVYYVVYRNKQERSSFDFRNYSRIYEYDINKSKTRLLAREVYVSNRISRFAPDLYSSKKILSYEILARKKGEEDREKTKYYIVSDKKWGIVPRIFDMGTIDIHNNECVYTYTDTNISDTLIQKGFYIYDTKSELSRSIILTNKVIPGRKNISGWVNSDVSAVKKYKNKIAWINGSDGSVHIYDEITKQDKILFLMDEYMFITGFELSDKYLIVAPDSVFYPQIYLYKFE